MNERPIQVLLVEDNPGDVQLVTGMLTEAKEERFSLNRVSHLGTALSRLNREDISVVLLDLMLPDGDGINTVEKVTAAAPEVPIVVLTGIDNDQMAMQAVQAGAQDYMVKGQVSGRVLARSMHTAIERHRRQRKLHNQALTDELTGLYNRRGFLTLARQRLKLACRMRLGVLLIYIDLDHLKHINDVFGHSQGDQALTDSAILIKGIYRKSDIIARLGGDEFVVLAVETGITKPEALTTCLRWNVETYNAEVVRPYDLSFSIGVARFDPENPSSIEDLLIEADEALYRIKKSKRGVT